MDIVLGNSKKSSNLEYRKFMTKNANKLMYENKKVYEKQSNQYIKEPLPQEVKSYPYLYHGVTDNSTPYGFENSDMKSKYFM